MRWSSAIERRRAANRAREKRGLPPRLPMTAYRNELPISTRQPDPQVAKMLYRHDPDLELLWVPTHSKWTLWRKLASGKMALVMELKHPPGVWLIQHLQRIDVTRNGTHTIREGISRFWQQLEGAERDQEAKIELRHGQELDDADKELETYALRNKRSQKWRRHPHRPGKRIVIGLHSGKVLDESRNDADQCLIQSG